MRETANSLSSEFFPADKLLLVSFANYQVKFDVAEALREELTETILDCTKQGYRHFVLDLSPVRLIDSCGLALLRSASITASSCHARLYLCGVCPLLSKIFGIVGLAKDVRVFSNEAEALREIRGSASS